MRRILWQAGQTTAEYALVLLAAAAVAAALYFWVTQTGALTSFFEDIIKAIKGMVGAGG